MNIDWQKAGIKKLAAIISAHLQKNGIEVVLVGGACVSLYSDNQYMSYDIDLITESSIRKIIPVLKELGFKNTGGRLFENPQCKSICLLTPTDCIRDRLAAYFFWNDQQSLDQAVMVAKRNKIHLPEIKE